MANPVQRTAAKWARSCEAIGLVIPAPASTESIAQAESRLSMVLPPSYRAFLEFANGWPEADDSRGSLLPVEQLAIVPDHETGALAMLMDARTALSDRRMQDWIASHRQKLVRIASGEDGFLMLDMSMPTEEDEYPVCFAAPWIPGTRRYRSFHAFLRKRLSDFEASHSVVGAGQSGKPKRLNLRRSPQETVDDPEQFISELQRLSYFKYTDSSRLPTILAEFRMNHKWGRTPGAALPLLDAATNRCVWFGEGEIMAGRAPLILSKLRDMLSRMGVSVPEPSEEMSDTSYAARLGDVRHTFFKMRNGFPGRIGGDHPSNGSRYYSYESAKLLTKYLKSVGSDQRIATVELSLDEDRRIGCVCLTDEQSYLFSWSGCVDNYCRPLRPDVFG